MEEYVLRTYNLCKKLGARNVVDHLNLSIRKGDIYGFIGPNGAGKTTAMKVILSLLDPSEGVIELFGRTDYRESLHRVGSLIEAPGLYPDCSAYENMKRFSIISGGDDMQIAELLNMVGLDNVGKKKVRAFSLGMKQRLGIAVALLGSPELLILDEPVNGLDPMGMRDVRDVIQRINKEMGVTFFISSHLLGELEKISTVYGIIKNGVLTDEITAEELSKKCQGNIRVRSTQPQKALELIRSNFENSDPVLNGEYIDVKADSSLTAAINRMLVMNNIGVTELGYRTVGYEDYLIQRMGLPPAYGNMPMPPMPPVQPGYPMPPMQPAPQIQQGGANNNA